MRLSLGIGWWLIGLALFAALAGALAWTSAQLRWSTPKPLTDRNLPRLVVAQGNAPDTAWAESAALLGPAPLFLPTAVNSSRVEPPAALRREPGAQTATFAPRFWHTEQSLSLDVASPFPEVREAADATNIGLEVNPWSGVGERAVLEGKSLIQRAMRLEAHRSPGGEMIWSQDLSAAEAPALPAGEWAPLEFLLAISPEGPSGSPVLVRGSGLAEWDQIVQAWLLRQSKLGLRLWPGLYSVKVGP